MASVGAIELSLGELCQDRDWALNFFTKREEVQLAATSKDKQLAISMVCIFCAFGFEIGSSKFATGRHLLLINIAHCLGACPVP